MVEDTQTDGRTLVKIVIDDLAPKELRQRPPEYNKMDERKASMLQHKMQKIKRDWLENIKHHALQAKEEFGIQKAIANPVEITFYYRTKDRKGKLDGYTRSNQLFINILQEVGLLSGTGIKDVQAWICKWDGRGEPRTLVEIREFRQG